MSELDAAEVVEGTGVAVSAFICRVAGSVTETSGSILLGKTVGLFRQS